MSKFIRAVRSILAAPIFVLAWSAFGLLMIVAPGPERIKK